MIELTPRQLEIISLVKQHAPITGEQIAEMLGATRSTIRSDLGLLVMLGYIDAKPKVGYFIGQRGMKENMGIAQITSRPVKEVMGVPIVLRETATVSDAVVTLFLENVGSLVVVDAAGSLAGIVSRKDLLKVTLGNPQASSVLLSMVMTRYPNVATVSPNDTVLDAMSKMMTHEVDGLPVVETAKDGESTKVEVVGRITKTTITRLLYEAATGQQQ